MTLLAVNGDIIEYPVTLALRERMTSHHLEIEVMPERDMCKGLTLGKLQMALISPFAYAKIKGKIRIVEELAISSGSFGRTALLFFQHNLPTIKNIVYRRKEDHDMYRFLGKIVMREFLDIEANWQEIPGHLHPPEDLPKYPVIFASGNDALTSISKTDVYLDLTEEWSDKTHFALVHKILVVSENFSDTKAIEIIKNATRTGLEHLSDLFARETFPDTVDRSALAELLKQNYSYESDSMTRESLEFFLQYVFYYGESDYLPSLRMF